MKYLKTYENFDEQDLGRFSQEDMIEPENNIQAFDDDDDEYTEYPEFPEDMEDDDEFQDEEENRIENRRMWGDERMVESRKRSTKKEDKCEPNCKCKDKKDKKEDKCGPNCKCKDDKEKPKGLTAAQKKLPEGLRRAIEAKQKK